MSKSAKTGTSDEILAPRSRLISIDSTAAPAGDASDDWLVYRIAQGKNVVTGYRRGTLENVTLELERLVDSFNERLLVKGRPYRSAGRPPKNARPLEAV